MSGPWTPDDDFAPLYCLGCRNKVPRAQSNANGGFCDDCLDMSSRIASAPNPNAPKITPPPVQPPPVAHGVFCYNVQARPTMITGETALILVLLCLAFPVIFIPVFALAAMGIVYALPLIGLGSLLRGFWLLRDRSRRFDGALWCGAGFLGCLSGMLLRLR